MPKAKTTKRKRKAPKKTYPEEILNERAVKFLEGECKLLQKLGIDKRIIVTFPTHRRVPLLGRLALVLLKWSRGVLDLQFILTRK